MSNVERRSLARPGQLTLERAADGAKSRKITGYAAVFYRDGEPETEYRIYDDLVERMLPGAFDDAIKSDDVRALFNHDPSQILGRNKAGTLSLTVDKTGLRYTIDLPETRSADELLAAIERGDIDGSSFGFMPITTTYREEPMSSDSKKKQFVILREKVKLLDVSPVTFPAYEGTSVGLRSLRAEVDAWRESVEKVRGIPRSVVLAKAKVVEIESRRS